jgi:transposase-like protein
LLVVSDGACGIIKAIEVCFSRSTRQRCLAHRMRNSIRISEFERRQMAALRQELDQDYEAAVSLDANRSKPAPATKIPSRSRT